MATLLTVACEPVEPCVNDVFEEVRSPDGAWEAVAFLRRCGEATDVSTHVSVIRAEGTVPNRTGNAFALPGRAEVRLLWAEPDLLVVGRSVRGYREEAAVGPIRVVFTSRRLDRPGRGAPEASGDD